MENSVCGRCVLVVLPKIIGVLLTIEEAVRDLCRAFKDGRLPNSMADDIYYNVRRMKNLQAA